MCTLGNILDLTDQKSLVAYLMLKWTNKPVENAKIKKELLNLCKHKITPLTSDETQLPL